MVCVIDSKDINIVETISKLNDNIGNRVICRFYRLGNVCEKIGILNDFDFFSSVEINSMKIPFVSDFQSISKITLEETGEVLYFNPYVKEDERKFQPVESQVKSIIKRVRKIFY